MSELDEQGVFGPGHWGPEFQELYKLGRQLDDANEAVNALIVQYEEKFKEAKPGVRFGCAINSEGDEVWYGKIGNSWRLLWVQVRESGPIETPLVNAPQHLRVLALQHMRQLLQAGQTAVGAAITERKRLLREGV